MQTQSKQGNWLIIFAVIALAALPLIFVKGDYSGADGQAEEAILTIRPDYQPWFGFLFEPPSAEIESFLFASQAGIGAGLIGYVIGRYQGRGSLKK
ncbi:MAG: energy-coupling factor ABC transporter substrate-binding protein [Cyanobacteria bacterium RI_101]|nr:energy-coupling factor ABC transporter substrate-binding protein [Cyanobacteria bacterium RI_101]